MQLTGLLSLLRDSVSYGDLLASLQSHQNAEFDILRAGRPYLLATLAQDWDGPIVYVTPQVKRAYNVSEQLPVWLGSDHRVFRFAEPSPMFYDRVPWDKGVIQSRIETLSALMDETTDVSPIVVTSARALMQRTLAPSAFYQATLSLQVGDRFALDKLLTRWVGMGYEPAPMVIEPGTFSRRGGILDVYPLASPYPVRIEFFDDEIDSLREFDPATQRSIGTIQEMRIPPAREVLPETTTPIAQQLQGWFSDLLAGEQELSAVASDLESLMQGVAFPYLEHYLPYVAKSPVSLLDYASDDTLVIVEDWDSVEASVQDIEAQAQVNRQEALSLKQIAESHPQPYLGWSDLMSSLNNRQVLRIGNIAESTSKVFAPGQQFGGQLRTMLPKFRDARNKGERIVVVTEQSWRLKDLWTQEDASAFIPTVKDIHESLDAGAVVFVDGVMQEGFRIQGQGGVLNLVTDAEIFGWSRSEPRRRQQTSRQSARRTPETDYTDWDNGTFVVHVDYGVGKFAGMRHRTVEGTEKEYLLIEYQGTDTLFVPIHQADRLTRYVGPDDKAPKLNQLGKAVDWVKKRKKAQKNAEEEARELLEIYAKRAKAQGHPYALDNPWQHELEASFPYVETDDQLRVVKEVKVDMESRIPMDRLICGDVGYGKTEVALRAAFKAVMDGKQVAILVPTTVLAQQHYETFSHRLEAFPVEVEMLSRFRTKAQQDKIVKRLKNGEVDIIIGTHRLLSEDIDIKELGLVIIDEEQRFGVKHKEHFKKLRAQVDILTLTATPIPRTLYMSLSGIRDISMIQTPPEERLPVMTHVGAFDVKLVRQAIMREIERGGQVFVVHNRVQSIYVLQERLQEIVPEARIVVGHGQMSPRALERVMSEFSHGEYDILLATSIIENGIDMPRVNTLIVDRADWFGMSQLYQLRGRVGRSAQQAYAYFFHARGKMTDEAYARLETLAENTVLGSGMQIAMKDMEIRGAGDILSTKQSGAVATVGLHLYTQMLQRAIQEQKGQTDTSLPVPASAQEKIVIDLPTPAYLPNDWIPEMALRLQIYRRIGGLLTRGEVEEMRQELRDRFGELPVAVEGLLYQIEIKLLAQSIKATSVIKPRDHILIKLPYLAGVNRNALALSLGDDVEVSRTAVELRFDAEKWQWQLIEMLVKLDELMQAVVE